MILRSFESAASGMRALIDMNDNTANNLANVNTVGYKKAALTFKNVYDANVVDKSGAAQNSNVRSLGELSMGSEVQKLTYDFAQGALSRTDNPLDLSIQGDGFFKIRSVDGEISYTRNGAFTLNNNSFLTTQDGEYVLDTLNQPIKVDLDEKSIRSMQDIVITERGQIQINNERNQEMQQTIRIADFKDKENMLNIGVSKFVPKNPQENPEIASEKYTIVQGGLEMSNSNVINEMINTINTSRNYESLSKLVRNNGEMLSRAMNVGRIKGAI